MALFLSGCAAITPPPPKTLPESFLAHTWQPFSDSVHDLKFYKNGVVETYDRKKLTSHEYYRIIHQAGPEDFYLINTYDWYFRDPSGNHAPRFHYDYIHIWLEPSIVDPAEIVLQRDIYRIIPTEEEWVTLTPEQHWQKIKKHMEESSDQVSSSAAYARD
ncbi:MAG: hypothetical protein IT559_06550 [Alphaproteobacteria bacterium]|nr:hypothetical protein [Alphaproteobacteria bacterium]